ncbi:MAG: 30S ribosome-binding factor RbfA [Eggerthellaceae bacterium]|nr:30S ribosome-binding factor RbfA [Eggerthellaceae bacterium]
MKQGSSNRKVNEQAREVVASILLFDISDPRLHLVTVTGCEVSYDRSACNVFYTTEPERYDEVERAFASARGRIRSLMAKKLSWRVAPELRFHLDRSVDEAESIAYALDRDRARNMGAYEDEPAEAPASDTPDEGEAPADAADEARGVEA